MTFRRAAVLTPLLLLGVPGPVLAADTVQPRANTLLSGTIDFPHAQPMTAQTGLTDGSRLRVRMGFDGRCTGGKLGEIFASRVPARETVRVRGGAFSASLTATSRDFGGVSGRTVGFRWRFEGRFTAAAAATAKVTGTAVVRRAGKVVARCEIAKPAAVKLTEDG